MDALTLAMTILANGLLTITGELVSWVAGCALVMFVGLGYLAKVEIAELDRSSFKPEVELH